MIGNRWCSRRCTRLYLQGPMRALQSDQEATGRAEHVASMAAGVLKARAQPRWTHPFLQASISAVCPYMLLEFSCFLKAATALGLGS